MGYIDLHCDTLMKAYLYQKEDIYEFPQAMTDIRRLLDGGAAAQFFAIFLPPPGSEKLVGHPLPPDDEYIRTLAGILKKTVSEHDSKLQMAYNAGDLRRNREAGKLSAFLTIEDGRSVDGKLENLESYYKLGIRLISLTWNLPNCFGAPNSTDPAVMKQGLTDFGKEAILYMNELGILVDVSHLSDGGFYDVAKLSRKPFVASHSNCRSLSPHPRNLTDDMIRKLAEKGGVAGVNFGPEFLNGDPSCKESRVKEILAHIRHLMNVGGEECVAIGTDFDGIQGNFEIQDPVGMRILYEEMEKEGLSAGQIEKITYGNVARVIADVVSES